MKEKKKIPWGLIYVGLTVVVMIVFGLVNTEFAGMFSVIANLSLGFVALAVLMTGVFLVTEGGIIHMLLRAQGEHVGFWTTVKIGLIGIYYSYITPSSTGGQPAQVVYLRRDKVSVGNSTAVLFVKFFAYQLAFVLCTVASLIYMYPSLKRDDPQLIPIVLLGIAINGLWIIAIPLLFSPKILKKLCGGVTKLLLKCTFLKKRENYIEKVHGFEADFSSYTMKFRSKMRYVLLAILWSIPQVILQMSVLYVVFRAFSLDLPYGELLCMQTMLQASVCLTRCPVRLAHRSSASPCSLNRILHPAIFCTPPCLSGDSSHITSSCCSARSSSLSISSCLVAAESRKRRSLQEKNNSTRFGAARRSCAVFMFFYDIFPCVGKH